MVEVFGDRQHARQGLFFGGAVQQGVDPAGLLVVQRGAAEVGEIPALDQEVAGLGRPVDAVGDQEAAIGLLQQRHPVVPLGERAGTAQGVVVDLTDKLVRRTERVAVDGDLQTEAAVRVGRGKGGRVAGHIGGRDRQQVLAVGQVQEPGEVRGVAFGEAIDLHAVVENGDLGIRVGRAVILRRDRGRDVWLAGRRIARIQLQGRRRRRVGANLQPGRHGGRHGAGVACEVDDLDRHVVDAGGERRAHRDHVIALGIDEVVAGQVAVGKEQDLGTGLGGTREAGLRDVGDVVRVGEAGVARGQQAWRGRRRRRRGVERERQLHDVAVSRHVDRQHLDGVCPVGAAIRLEEAGDYLDREIAAGVRLPAADRLHGSLVDQLDGHRRCLIDDAVDNGSRHVGEPVGEGAESARHRNGQP